MSTGAPPIIVSSLDLERIEVLLESPAQRHFPGADALREELARANIVKPDAMPADVVTMNSTATVIDEGNREEYQLTLVYPRDADGSPGKVSVLAPVGSAILDCASARPSSGRCRAGANSSCASRRSTTSPKRAVTCTAEPIATRYRTDRLFRFHRRGGRC